MFAFFYKKIYNYNGDIMFGKKKNISYFYDMKEILLKAKEGKYAVCQFNINNLEWAKYILEECQSLNSPVIIGVSESSIKYMGGYNVVSSLIISLIKDLGITIPVVLHLDHGTTVESCKLALEAGFNSVMIDASKYPIDENIKIVNEVINLAKGYNAAVEAELGRVGGNNGAVISEIVYANVDECVKLVNNCKVTSLAPALGSVHGLYNGVPNIDFTRMLEIGIKTNLPLVLHGGTGIPNDKILQSIDCGVSKINFNTELQMVWKRSLDNFIVMNPNIYDPRLVIGSGEKAIKAVVRTKVTLVKSDNKA